MVFSYVISILVCGSVEVCLIKVSAIMHGLKSDAVVVQADDSSPLLLYTDGQLNREASLMNRGR